MSGISEEEEEEEADADEEEEEEEDGELNSLFPALRPMTAAVAINTINEKEALLKRGDLQ